jgi:DNA invertase Pin-like site-specific DNA recombinase
MQNVVLYVRVSTDDQSTANQLQALRRYAASRGWTIVKEYRDSGVSGAASKRPALERLMRDATASKFDGVLVWKLDRLGRSLQDLLARLQALASAKVGSASMTEGFDLSNASGRLLMQVIGAVAEFERSLIVERTQAGLARARSQGKAIGRPRKALDLGAVKGLSHRQAARKLGVHWRTVYNHRHTASSRH